MKATFVKVVSYSSSMYFLSKAEYVTNESRANEVDCQKYFQNRFVTLLLIPLIRFWKVAKMFPKFLLIHRSWKTNIVIGQALCINLDKKISPPVQKRFGNAAKVFHDSFSAQNHA